MIHVLVSRRKRGIFENYLGHWGREVAPLVRLHFYEDLPEATSLPRGTWLFSDIDELKPALLDLATTLRDALVEAGLPVLNDPRAVLRRGDLLRTLHRRGMNRFRALEPDEDLSDLRFPVFLRRAADHNGPLTPLLHGRAEVDRWITRFRAFGTSRSELLVVEFLNTADAAGLFRKYAAFIVRGHVIARSLNRSRSWIVKHGTTEFDLDYQREELAFIETNPDREAVAEIARIARIDYGRIDYAVVDGEVQTWEINLCPTIGRGASPPSQTIPAEIREVREHAKQRFYGAFAAAWRAADALPEAVGDLAAPFSAAQRRAARGAMRRGHRLSILRGLLRPAKPLVIRAVDGLLVRESRR